MQERPAADAMLEALGDLGVPYFFGNGGTDFPDIVEAFAARPGRAPLPMAIPHENLAVSMAHGFYLASGEMAAVMVHVSVGTANALCGLMNAARDNVPILMMAGRTPLTEVGSAASRDVFIHWGQESFDQGAMLREYVKWDYEVRHPDQIAPAMARAAAIAQADPVGPVYVSLPREHLHAKTGPHAIKAVQTPHHVPDQQALQKVARQLDRAQRPLIITSVAGSTQAGFDALTELAEQRHIPVVEFRPRAISLPWNSPAHAGGDPHPLLPKADLVIAVDIDVPWLPSKASMASDAALVAIGCDPMLASYPYWGFAPDIALQGHSPSILKSLVTLAKEQKDREDWMRDCRSLAPEAREGFTFSVATRVIAEALQDALFVNENPLDPRQLRLATAGRYFTSSPAGGLGLGLGAALGVKLANRDALVVCAVGDGAYQFGGPTPFHHTARREDLPVLTIVFDNAKWGGVERATHRLHPDSLTKGSNDRPFIDLAPSPEYGMICEASGGASFAAHDPATLELALNQAAEAVRSGQQALVHLRIG